MILSAAFEVPATAVRLPFVPVDKGEADRRCFGQFEARNRILSNCGYLSEISSSAARTRLEEQKAV
jgi:hypothetical protein